MGELHFLALRAQLWLIQVQFNTELDETEVTREDLRIWKTCNATTNRPPAMIIEVYIDTEDLTNNQSLAILDDQGRRWDVEEALASRLGSADDGTRGRGTSKLVLERWQIQLGESSRELSKDLSVILPRVYKNSIVLFRSLLAFARLLPTYNLAKRKTKSRSTAQSPKIKYQIFEASRFQQPYNTDPLTVRLFDPSPRSRRVDEVVQHYAFNPIDSPAGPFSIQVTYRLHCDLRIDDSEALLSSHFIGMDEEYFEPSLGRHRGLEPVEKRNRAQGAEAGSLPKDVRRNTEQPDPSQAYGSLSTFHQVGPATGSSPLSALRAARDRTSQSPPEAAHPKAPPSHRLSHGSRSSLRSSDGPPAVGRRPSVSFMPFKTPSLSASPSQADHAGSLPRGSLGRTSTLSSLAEARIPSTLGPQGIVQSRGSPSVSDQAVPSSNSSSPKPSKYSSSFGHRKAKLSGGGSSKADEDNNSSGKGSLNSSKGQPSSGILAEGGGGSSGSIPTDDDNISEFLKLLDQKKNLKSFGRSGDQSVAESSTRRTNAALNRFQKMRNTNAELSESISSSLMMHRSSSSSSRQLSSVPPMVAGTSVSTSSSPGKPISPHTPHTPAIPSRLSANSIVEYPRRGPGSDDRLVEEEPRGEEPSQESYRDPSTGPIDIPTSPRPVRSSYRRSSSVAQRTRAVPIEDDFPWRSASLDAADDRPQLSVSALLRLQGANNTHEDDQREVRGFRPLPTAMDGGNGSPTTGQASNEQNAGSHPQMRAGSYRPRIGHGRGHATPQGSLSSLDRASAGSGSSDQPGGSRGGGGRYSFSRPPAGTFEEDEPFLFAMSDLGSSQQQHGRKGSGAGPESGSSSRKGSRRTGIEGQGHHGPGKSG